MASKSAYRDSEPGAEIEEMLDILDKLLDRLKVMYEQYFLGIQKIAPSQLHTEAERKLRDLTQIQIRNTALRYRFATMQQKWGSYNNYWRRTVRQIEQGTYVRTLARVKRQAAAGGADIPDEILAAMPKRMRDQVARDRALAQAQAKRRGQLPKEAAGAAGAAGAGAAVVAPVSDGADNYADADWSLPDGEDDVAEISHPVPRDSRPMHRIDTQEMDKLDVDQMLDNLIAPDVKRDRPPTPAIEKPRRDDRTNPGIGAAGQAPAPGARGAKPPAIPAIPPVPPRAPTTAMPRVGAPPPTPGAARPRTVSANVVSRAATVPGPPSPAAPASPASPASRPPAPASTPSPAHQARPPAPPRAATTPGPAPRPPARPEALPPGMTEADVRTLYQKYARARELVGERNDDTTYQALLRTLHQQAPKIMAQYKAKGVEFGVVIKDKQVVLKAKPKT